MKKLYILVLTLTVLANVTSAGPTNGGFESGMTGWTKEYTNDGSNYGYSNQADVTNAYHHSGQNALWGKASIVGDVSYWAYDDWAHTYVWSGVQNLSNVTSIQLYLTDFQYNPYHFGWGFGQDIYLMLNDGINSASALLIDHHEEYYPSLFDAGYYTTSTGSDGRTWYGFDVPVSGFSGINLSNAKVGIRWEARNWYDYSSQSLWVGGAVDDIKLVAPIPAPGAILLGSIGISLVGWLKRRRTL